MLPTFPFSAIVGQETLKRALILTVIQPSLGGVLIRGTKGVAKSTAVRALANLLPPIETVAGCPFQRFPKESLPDWPLPGDAVVITKSVPLVELPLGATEDRVLGSLHLEKALRGERSFEPGLLAAANRGILYIDEVNLLPDHLVDILLDAAASGVHHIEREGFSLQHPARFVLIGTMNPEEGELRPQLLDRFGLVVDIADLADARDRAEAVRRRLEFESDPAGFQEKWKSAEEIESERIVCAQQLLVNVVLSEDILQAISERCLVAGVDGLRADLTMAKAAAAWAAYQGRTDVESADLDVVAELALAHRRTTPPVPPPPDPASKKEDRGSKIEDGRPKIEDRTSSSVLQPQSYILPSRSSFSPHSSLLPSAGIFVPRIQPGSQTLSEWRGRWRHGSDPRRGRAKGYLRAYAKQTILSWAGTIRAASLHQRDRGRSGPNDAMILRIEDLRGWPKRGPGGCLLLFVVDASGSMATRQRMRQTKSAILSLLMQSYQHRDQIALMAFRGSSTEIVLSPTCGLRSALRAIERLPVGGTTPLALGLMEAQRLAHRQQRRQPRQPIWLILLTDGRANVALAQGDPWRDALTASRALRSNGLKSLVINTETGWPRFHRSMELAQVMGASCVPLDEVLGRPLSQRHRMAV
jgi:magnesium chelatase subunit D